MHTRFALLALVSVLLTAQPSYATPIPSDDTVAAQVHTIPEIDPFLGSKRMYPINGTGIEAANVQSQPTNQCTLIQFQMVARHGSRNPEAADITNFDAIQATFNNATINPSVTPSQSLTDVQSFQNPFSLDQAGLLLSRGVQEHHDLAKRILATYADFMSQFQQTQLIQTRASAVNRSTESGIAFLESFWEGKQDLTREQILQSMSILDSTADPLLRPFADCHAYTEGQKMLKKTSQSEQLKFADKTLGDALQRLNFIFSLNLTQNDMLTIYSLCQFDVLAADEPNRFCSLLTDEDLLNLNFIDDIDSSFKLGYDGGVINTQLACPLMTDIVSWMDQMVTATTNTSGSIVTTTTYATTTTAYVTTTTVYATTTTTYATATSTATSLPRIVLNFAHAETLMVLDTLMGSNEDSEPLLANSSVATVQNPNWDTSVFLPMAGNKFFELWDCGDATDPTLQKDRFFVRMLQNEVPQAISGCPGSPDGLMCSLTEFEAKLQPHLGCDFNNICGE
ncbi:histidine phosphatase superfamily [Endogone sp. FLAS-F59071]|nr:histidine phosphatase superfamily [Endogone sp. FLAS-F59071]|eukprot:RUS18520.1 histidine phosphatase superfamily [Endogone sp. FLAS-F59071]